MDNLLTVLTTNELLDALAGERAILLFLGDLIHSEDPERLDDMAGSLVLTDIALGLKALYPLSVFFLLGNHESFSPDVTKRGVSQGEIWDAHVTRTRGQAYRDHLQELYDCLPVIAVGEDFVACHAGPPDTRVNKTNLIEIRRHPRILRAVTTTRLRSAAVPAGYGRLEIRDFRKDLRVPNDCPLIVGHYPRSGDRSFWLDVGQIPEHHVLYSARPDRVGVFARSNGAMVPMEYRSERFESSGAEDAD